MVEILKLMLGQDFEDEIFGNVLFVFVCVVLFLDHEVQTHIMTSPLSLSLGHGWTSRFSQNTCLSVLHRNKSVLL